MRSLADLLSTPAGRALLAEAGSFDDPDAFLRALRPPSDGTGGLPVFVHQQVYLDYRASVVAKVLALRDLHRRDAATVPEFLWIDTDRAGSDKLSLRLYLESPAGAVAVRLAPPGCERREPRAIRLDAGRLSSAVARIEATLRAGPGGAERLRRFADLKPLLTAAGSLADLSRRLSAALFTAVLDFEPRPLLVSALIAEGTLTPLLDRIVDRQPAFVAAVNDRIAALRAGDVDPHLKPLPADWLPLFMTGPADGRRLRLRLERDGGLPLAVAADSDGTRHRFPLDRGLAALGDRLRWSPDVVLPLLLNRRSSGLVAGRSSALYLLVLQPAAEAVLGLRPLPVLVPREWDIFTGAFDSLFAACLDGRRV